MNKHTPGPWAVVIDKQGGDWKYNIRTSAPHNPAGGLGKHIASVNPLMQARGENNAALIAAAPDLLAACKAVEDAWTGGESGDWRGALDLALGMARAAIAKAEGGAE